MMDPKIFERALEVLLIYSKVYYHISVHSPKEPELATAKLELSKMISVIIQTLSINAKGQC